MKLTDLVTAKTTVDIRSILMELQDTKYRDFQGPLISSVPRERIIGVRTPELRKLAKELGKLAPAGGDANDTAGNAGQSSSLTEAFLAELPHTCFEEDQLHAFLIAETKDYALCMERLEAFLPYVDNWATCDQMTPKVLRKNLPNLEEHIVHWLASGETYTVRFGIKMLMDHYLEAAFDPKYPEMVAAVQSDEYYVKMMIAWYFATALAKQYEAVLPYLTEERLSSELRRMAIQKAVESRRISEERKSYLKELRKQL